MNKYVKRWKNFYYYPICVCHANGILPHLFLISMASQIKYMQIYTKNLTWGSNLNLGQVR